MSWRDWISRPDRRGDRSAGGAGGAVGTDDTIRVLKDAAADAQRSRLPQMAAALSYRTIFGLLPVLALVLVVLKGFADDADVSNLIRTVMSSLGLDKIAIDQTAARTGLSGIEREIMGPPGPEGLGLASSGTLDQWITGLIGQINQINFKAVGAVGVVLLLYAALSMIVEIERAFNQIFRVPIGRSWGRRFVNYTSLLVYSPICLFLTFYSGQQLDTWTQHLAQTPQYAPVTTGLVTLIAAGQVLITAFLLLVLYTVLPNTRVKILPAIFGALLGAIAFEGLKFGFVQYVQLSARVSYARLYGSLALVPLFLLWVYMTWLIVLFGLQVTYQLQHGRWKTRALPLGEGGPALVDPAAAVVVLSQIGRAFGGGQGQTPKAICRATGLGESVVGLVTAKLVERGLLHRIDRAEPNAEPMFVLARPPSSIRVSEILRIGFELGPAGGSALNPTLERLRQAQIEAAADETLADAAGLGRELDGALPVSTSPGTPTPIVHAPGAVSAATSSPTPTPAPRRITPVAVPGPAPTLPGPRTGS